MKVIIRAVLAWAALCAVFIQAGNAADDPGPAGLPPSSPGVSAPIYSWAGIYMGVNAGYGASRLSADYLSGSQSGSGWIVGGQLGANYQFGVFVLGWEVDERWSNQRATYSFSGITVTDDLVAFGTARVRGGVAMDRVLLYLTGGGAYVARAIKVPAFISDVTARAAETASTSSVSGTACARASSSLPFMRSAGITHRWTTPGKISR